MEATLENESPSQRIARLESELNAAQATIRNMQVGRANAEERISDLESALFRSDELRGAIVGGASLSAKVTLESLKRLELYEPIVEAAIDYFEQDGRAGTHTALCRAVEAEINRRELVS